MTYQAYITKLQNVRPHSNADRLKLATVFGNQIVVGIDSVEGERGIYFPSDGQLSEEFATYNDLVRRKDANGNNAGGMFDLNRRVRIQKLRGEKSDGFFIGLDSLKYTGVDISTLEDGFAFDTINEHLICQRYETPSTKRAQKQNSGGIARKENIMFKRHFDTQQLNMKVDEIKEGSRIIITEKVHGTSHRLGYIIKPVEYNKFQRFFNSILSFFRLEPKRNWIYNHGTRKVDLGDKTKDSYYNTDFRGNATQQLIGNLRKGEVVYLEIAGWENDQKSIMNIHDVTKLDKSHVKQFGPKMIYSYGARVGEQKIYVYRITMVNEDGYSIEYSWDQVKARCSELGVEYVPEIDNFIYDHQKLVEDWYSEQNIHPLINLADSCATGESLLDPRHIKEGVCLRVETDKEMKIYKYKSFEFKTMEFESKSEDKPDVEEAS